MKERKGLLSVRDRATEFWLLSLSKAALADLVVGLVRQVHGEALDGKALTDVLVEVAEPVLRARGDRVLPADEFFRLAERSPHLDQAKVREVRAVWEASGRQG